MPDKGSFLYKFNALYWDLWPYCMLAFGLIVSIGSVSEGKLLIAFAGVCTAAWGGIGLARRHGRGDQRLGIIEAVVGSCALLILLWELLGRWRAVLGVDR